MKQDRNGVRTAQDLERKYIREFTGQSKAVEVLEKGINKVNAELENFIIITLSSLGNLESDSLVTWYYSGEPSLSTYPASEWDAYEDHEGDLYYDKATGKAYRFEKVGNSYQWGEVEDRAVISALALANASGSAADKAIQVFVTQPVPPYSNGDLWFKDGEIFICQISKADNETYADKDFIEATKYTDDTVANQVGENLEVVRGTVTTIQESVDAFKIDIETTVKSVNDLQQETVENMERMSYTFGTKDLSIANSNDPVNARINNQGLKVYNYTTLQSIFNHRGAGIRKLIVTGDTQLANISVKKGTDENGDACTDINFLVSNIQDLTDLEVD